MTEMSQQEMTDMSRRKRNGFERENSTRTTLQHHFSYNLLRQCCLVDRPERITRRKKPYFEGRSKKTFKLWGSIKKQYGSETECMTSNTNW